MKTEDMQEYLQKDLGKAHLPDMSKARRDERTLDEAIEGIGGRDQFERGGRGVVGKEIHGRIELHHLCALRRLLSSWPPPLLRGMT